MEINTETIIAISKVNQNFSEAAKLTDQLGLLTIMKNSKPKFVMMTFEKFKEYEKNEVDD